ncbi:uncharacterized protein LOC143465934 isoform X2 [Clavelina lepadiformis]|uniref:uncharacterized protein LOC143465934 isoform X2 n=1 Tax=Clavelina lepadiformis TaxID=159417 RepID=UPI004042D73B
MLRLVNRNGYVCTYVIDMQCSNIPKLPSENSAFTRTGRLIHPSDSPAVSSTCVNLFNRTTADGFAVKTLLSDAMKKEQTAFLKRWCRNTIIESNGCLKKEHRRTSSKTAVIPVYDWVPIDKAQDLSGDSKRLSLMRINLGKNLRSTRPESPVPFLCSPFKEFKSLSSKEPTYSIDKEATSEQTQQPVLVCLTPPSSPEELESVPARHPCRQDKIRNAHRSRKSGRPAHRTQPGKARLGAKVVRRRPNRDVRSLLKQARQTNGEFIKDADNQ